MLRSLSLFEILIDIGYFIFNSNIKLTIKKIIKKIHLSGLKFYNVCNIKQINLSMCVCCMLGYHELCVQNNIRMQWNGRML